MRTWRAFHSARSAAQRWCSLLPKPSSECVPQATDVAKGGGLLVAAGAALLASGTLGPVGAFIGASMVFAATLASYKNCEDVVAEEAQSKAK